MRHCCRNNQQQSCSRRQSRRDAAGSDQCDHPVRQPGNFRVGQYHDVPVDAELVAAPAIFGCLRRKLRVLVIVVLYAAIAVLVVKADEARTLPGAKPRRAILVGKVAVSAAHLTGLDRVDQVEARHGTDRGRRRVQDGDE